MPQDPETQVYNVMRRRDRAVTDEEWIKEFLRRAPTGSLATIDGGQPFINNNLFIYDETQQIIYVHTGPVGRTRTNIEKAGRVCFSVHEMGRFLPSKVAGDFSVEYASVVIFGTAVIVEELQEKRRFFERFFAKYFPQYQAGRDYVPAPERDVARPTLYKIEIEQWSCKKHFEVPDFPGAFRYGEQNS